MNPSSIAARFAGWVVYRRYVVVPAVRALDWVIVRRKPDIILGYAALVRRGILHLVAAKDMAVLSSYLPSLICSPGSGPWSAC